MLDGASRHTLYEVPVPGAITAFYTFGDRCIIAHGKGGALTLWEASSPLPDSTPEINLPSGSSLFCSGVDGTLCKIRLIDNSPVCEVIVKQPPLECIPSGYQLQTWPCTTTKDMPRCIECLEAKVCIFRGTRFLPLDYQNSKPLIRDSRSYPLLFWKDDKNAELLQSILVCFTDTWGSHLSHRQSSPSSLQLSMTSLMRIWSTSRPQRTLLW